MSIGKDGGGSTVETSSDIPERYRNFVDENIALAGTVANRPYIPYQGPRIAGFSPDQQNAFNFVRGMGGSWQMPLENANAAYTAGLNSAADPAVMMAKYRDPYTEQVIDATETDMNRNYDRSSEQARLSSPFGGSRLALREAEIEDARNRALASVGSQLRSDAFRTAAGLGQNATNQIMSAGDRALGLGGSALQMGGTYADMMAGIGQQQQGLQQALYDTAYGDFLDELNYPLTALSIRQSAIGQTPMGSAGRQPVVSQGGSGIGGLLSGAGSLIGALGQVGMFCWIAREAYDHDPKWLKVREWMLTKASESLRDRYARIGPRVAERIRHNPERKAEFRAAFDAILEAA